MTLPGKIDHYVAMSADDGCEITLIRAERVSVDREKGLLTEEAEKMWDIFAATWEEAMTIHYLRLGYGQYNAGEPTECPNKCGSYYFPEGSAHCPLCGHIN